jgi:tripartite-type tricarboxylate transporter receptor subunit TctC
MRQRPRRAGIARSPERRAQAKPLLGRPVLIENVTGASGSIAVGRAVRAAPDGYTLSIGDLATHVVNQVTYPLAYDLRTDLQPIALLATLSALIVARNGMPGGNLTELVAWLRANPNKASAGTGGVAGADHLAGLMFQNMFRDRRARNTSRDAGYNDQRTN